MKKAKKFLVGLLAFAFVSAFALGLTGCDDEKPSAGNGTGNGTNTEQGGCSSNDDMHQGGNTNDDNTQQGGNVHTHVFDQEVVENEYLETAATCTSVAIYHKTCECGEKGTDTFMYGVLGGHDPVKGICSVCTLEVGSNGLRYTLSDDETYYSVSKGTCTDVDIYIPRMYKNLPVTMIGDRAFYDCDDLASVTIGNSVTTIGDSAFSSCNSLTSVTIGDSVTTIGNSAFSSCNRLTEVFNKSSLNIVSGSEEYGKVGYYATHIVTEESERGTFATDENGYIIYTNGDDKVLVGYTGYETELTLPNDITWIKPYAIYENNDLVSVTIGDSVIIIGAHAFDWCQYLTELVIGNSVTTIGEEAFAGSALTSVIIGNSVETIGSKAFIGADFVDIMLPTSVITIEDSAFQGCSKLTNIVIPDFVEKIGDYAFAGCDDLESVTIGNCLNIIGEYAFYNCISLSNINISNSVTTIGAYAFYDCDSLESVMIPDSVTTIGTQAFYCCDNLINATAPTHALSCIYKLNLKTLAITSGERIEEYALFESKALETVTIGASIKTIGRSAFQDCISLVNITIPNSLMTIEEYAFTSCSKLADVTLADSIISIGFYAFYDCVNLECNIKDNLKYLGSDDNPYMYCVGMEDETVTGAVIDDACKFVGSGAFQGCLSLKTVTIPDSVIEIYGAFGVTVDNYVKYEISEVYYVGTLAQWCEIRFDRNTPLWGWTYLYINDEKVVDLLIPNGVEIISDYTFYGYAQAESVTIADTVTTIGDCAFTSCICLPSVTIPNSVKTIGEYAFADCYDLEEITFTGTVEEWNAIEKADNWNSFVPATKVVCSDGEADL